MYIRPSITKTIIQKTRQMTRRVMSVNILINYFSVSIPESYWGLGLGVNMGFALSLLLAWSSIKVCTSQCYLTPRVTTKPSETTFYRTNEIDLKSMLISLLDYVSIIKEEYWGRYGENLTLTYAGDGSCSMLGIGFPLDSVAASQVWGSPLTQVPLLTNVIRISQDRFYIPSENTSVLLNDQQF